MLMAAKISLLFEAGFPSVAVRVAARAGKTTGKVPDGCGGWWEVYGEILNTSGVECPPDDVSGVRRRISGVGGM